MSFHKRPLEKTRLHPRNKNRKRYDLVALAKSFPELIAYIVPNKYGADSIDFSNPNAVKLLNKALLCHYYQINHWDFPEDNLCPPIPGRADYIHHMADLLSATNNSTIPKGKRVICMDVGVGATCIYPIIGYVEYGWSFIGSDTAQKSLSNAQRIIDANPNLNQAAIGLRLQEDAGRIFSGIVEENEKIDLCICNPPFYATTENAQAETRRKVKNLTGRSTQTPTRNFSGTHNELVYPGGAASFIRTMIDESRSYTNQFFWFSVLVAKQSHLKSIRSNLKRSKATNIKVIPMGTGNKSTRIVAWTFLSEVKQKDWIKDRWSGS